MERLEFQVHVQHWNGFAAIFLRSKHHVLLDLQLVNGGSALLSDTVFDGFALYFEPYADESRSQVTDALVEVRNHLVDVLCVFLALFFQLL